MEEGQGSSGTGIRANIVHRSYGYISEARQEDEEEGDNNDESDDGIAEDSNEDYKSSSEETELEKYLRDVQGQ